MTEAQHTPGPWTAHEVFTNVITIMAPDEIANVNHGLGEITETERADARLIAAAPDMLDALSGLLKAIEDSVAGDWAVSFVAIETARAAIAKATGD